MKLEDLKEGQRLVGVLPDEIVEVIQPKENGPDCIRLTFQSEETGDIGQILLYREQEDQLQLARSENELQWDFGGDGAVFRLVSEAHRIHLAHLFDPFLAIESSSVTPLPHQVEAVYGTLLDRQPLRFLLADDPGAGKTIMAGLYIKELLLRENLDRCLICAPGSLVENWQTELSEKFDLDFTILSRELWNNSPTGNPFLDHEALIVRMDMIARNEDLQELLANAPDWGLVVVDEAHKMSASWQTRTKANYTLRYRLGQQLSRRSRNLLLMTATPHNGRDGDFQLFMRLLDQDRFESREEMPLASRNVEDLMRRCVKEDLVTFEGKPLFPKRKAHTVSYHLSPLEQTLYDDVTDYVCNQFTRIEEGGERRGNVVGFALTTLQRRLASSPEAIYQSLRRRRERLKATLEELLQPGGPATNPSKVLEAVGVDLDEADEELTAEELEELEEDILDQASLARTPEELEQEIAELAKLEDAAALVVKSGQDRKWEELEQLLRSDEMFYPDGRRRKMIIFTEHKDTLRYVEKRVARILGGARHVTTIDGSVQRQERLARQERFTHDRDVTILVATDAAGEGINLQVAHLMVNYDLPWNPNRLEQRFGRIHRIGQTEVCHMWNLVAEDTREGQVFKRLMDKIAVELDALGGKVFDVLGEAFSETPLKDLLLQAIREGQRPEMRDYLDTVIDATVSQGKLRELVNRGALANEVMSKEDLMRSRDEMERAQARRLQPHFISSFFRHAFSLLGGRLVEKEPGRFEIPHVPRRVQKTGQGLPGRRPILDNYTRITFQKDLIHQAGKPVAAFIAPGHPLLEAVSLAVRKEHNELFQSGAVLLDPEPDARPRLLVYLQHEVVDGRRDSSGQPLLASREFHFLEVEEDGTIHDAGVAPYLDYLAPLQDERSQLESATSEFAAPPDWTAKVMDFAADQLVPQHLTKVREFRATRADKLKVEIRRRLSKEIAYWDQRAREAADAEAEGKGVAQLHSVKYRERRDDLQERLTTRLKLLEQEKSVSPKAPRIVACALVLPESSLRDVEPPSDAVRDTKASEAIAMQAIMDVERELGNSPRDVSAKRHIGYDIESRQPNGELRFIEVKGRHPDAPVITVPVSEVRAALNQPDKFILGLVEIDAGSVRRIGYVRRPWESEPDFHVSSVNFKVNDLWQKAQAPS